MGGLVSGCVEARVALRTMWRGTCGGRAGTTYSKAGGEREGGRWGGESEGGREGGTEKGKEGGREGGREGGTEAIREGGSGFLHPPIARDAPCSASRALGQGNDGAAGAQAVAFVGANVAHACPVAAVRGLLPRRSYGAPQCLGLLRCDTEAFVLRMLLSCRRPQRSQDHSPQNS